VTHLKLQKRADLVVNNVLLLEQAVANALTFRTFLEQLRLQNSPENGPHAAVVHVMRAAFLNALVGILVPIFDPDSKNDRASVAYTVQELTDGSLVCLLTFNRRGQKSSPVESKLIEACSFYRDLSHSELFNCMKRLRKDAIGHRLNLTAPALDVPYDQVFAFCDEAEVQVQLFCAGVGLGTPPFLAHREMVKEQAMLLCQTYLAGIRASVRSHGARAFGGIEHFAANHRASIPTADLERDG
jgi:hypothetical protein